MTEVPITYHPRLGHSKLRRWRDGARHVRFMVAEALWPRTRGTTTPQTTELSERQGVPVGGDLSANGSDRRTSGTEARDREGSSTTETAPNPAW